MEDSLTKLYSTLDLSTNAKLNLHLRNLIYSEIKNEFGVAKKTIIQSNKRGNNAQAKIMAIILLHKHLGMTKKEIAAMFHHNHHHTELRLRSFKNTKNGTKEEKIYSQNDFMIKYGRINRKINKERERWMK